MALERKDRVKDQTGTTGTGTVTIDGVAAAGYRTITSVHTTGATLRYTIINATGTEFEVGEGIWTAATNTLTRATVFASSNAGSLVNFSSGTKTVFTGPVAEDFDDYLALTGGTLTGKLTLPNVTTSAAPLNIGNPGTTDVPSSPVNGDMWINNNGLQFRQGTVTQTVATLGGTQTFTGAITFQGTLNASSNVNLGSNSTAATHSLGNGATTTGLTKTINIGTSGLSGSTTAITIGSSVSGATNTIASYGTLTHSGNLAFSGTGRRITGDFSNGTLTNRTLFQSSTTNSETSLGVVPNGTSRVANSAWFNTADPTNSGYLSMSISDTLAQIVSGAVGSGTGVPFAINTGGTVRLTCGLAGAIDLSTGLREARVAMGANAIDVLAGNYFTKTISGAATLTVANVPAAGTTASFILDLTNGGSATITWWSGVKWASGTAPTLTTSGRDVLGFFTHDGGTTWTGLVLGKDVK